MTQTPSFLSRGVIHFYGIIVKRNAFSTGSESGIRRGRDPFGIPIEGAKIPESNMKFVIFFYLSWSTIGICPSLLLSSSNFLLSQRDKIKKLSLIDLSSIKETLFTDSYFKI
eukprot:GHVR01060518.1.p1 GENE.GHVR01060518.1~~GHVR01060518.1.p1  ORF type:complete len:112 (+),score=2.47 GHVR01060518.1:366-701(+)